MMNRYKGTLGWSVSWICFVIFSIFGEIDVHADPVDWPTLGFTQIVSSIFNHPTVIAHAGDSSGRLFVVEQGGRIWVLQSSNVLSQPLLDISGSVSTTGPEQGLLGLAFPPGFPTNNHNHFYVNYTRKSDGAIVISRFSVVTTNSNIAATNSEQIVKIIAKPADTVSGGQLANHNGGQLAFGPDGYLYIGVGDGGSEGDPQNFGQNTQSLLGKVLRIDVEKGVTPYAVPPDNPFVGQTNYAPEIWALGLRNPWRFSFDRLTGDLYIADVGQNLWEEIDFQPAGSKGGENYGWRIMEGPTNYNVPPGFTNFSSLTLPVAGYSHFDIPLAVELGAAVTGGYVYRGPGIPRMDGIYFYGDFSNGWIWGLKQVGTNWESLVLFTPTSSIPSFFISTFGEDDAGNLYLADYYRGIIYHIQDSLVVRTPGFSQPAGIINSNTVIVSCSTTGAVIHYTVNGVDPTESDPVIASGTAIQVSTGITYKLKAFRPDLSPSGVAVATFTLIVGTPAFTPPPGPVTNGTLVGISTVTPGATVHYTLDGSTPTTSSPVYTGPITMNGNFTLRAVAVANGFGNSAIQSGAYPLAVTATPILAPALGPITNGTSLFLSCSTPNSVIYYTLDGSPPTTNSTIYSGPIVINAGITVSAVAFAANYAGSSVVSQSYQFKSVENTVVTTVAAGLPWPIGVCIDRKGNLYTANLGDVSVSKISPSGQVTTLALLPGSPSGICVDKLGILYVGDNLGYVWKIHPGGKVTQLAHLNLVYNATGQLEVDAARNVYLAYYGSIQKINPQGKVTLFAGPECADCEGWGQMVGVGIDQARNIYASTANRVWRIAQNGTNTLLAGGSPGYVDGPALSALFQSCQDAAVDSHTNVYVSDGTAIRKISYAGYVSTMAGSAVAGYRNGRGSEAQFNNTTGLCVDTNGNIYVADGLNYCIRKISPDTYGIGIPDWWQLKYFGHVGIDPNADPDHDGLNNYAEFWAGTDPLDPNSYLAMKSLIINVAGFAQVSWPSIAGKTYSVLYSDDLKTWNALGTPVNGNGSVVSATDSMSVLQAPHRMYRVFVNF